MNSILLAVDDGLTNANYNMADVFFLIGAAFAVLSGLAYVTGFVATVSTDPNPPNPPYGRYHQWAPALLAFAVAAVAFALFLL